MRTFQEILDIAIARKGSEEAVFAGMVAPKSAQELADIPGKDWLAMMARGIFQAGIRWKVVEAKWPGIQEAFHGFDIARCAFMSEDWFDDLLSDRRVIRSAPKIRAIQHNAILIQDIEAAGSSFGQKIADWPDEDYAGLLQWLAKDGSRLGGSTGPYMLRFMGRDGYIPSRDVVARLVAEGVIDKAPSSQKARAAMQAAINTWRAESGRSLQEISRVLAQSIDG